MFNGSFKFRPPFKKRKMQTLYSIILVKLGPIDETIQSSSTLALYRNLSSIRQELAFQSRDISLPDNEHHVLPYIGGDLYNDYFSYAVTLNLGTEEEAVSIPEELDRGIVKDGRTEAYLLVAAIDFGSTYSSWAFSFKHDQKKISCKRWIGGTNVSLKAPTTVLIKPDGKTLEAFGYEAEDQYIDMLSENDYTDHYYFNQFKMKLFDQNGLKRNFQLEDARGKLLPAKTVFSLAISYLREDLLKTCNQGLTEDVKETDVHWVLTVPAIWNDAAKQFMRESAVQGGIANDQLTIALEPEAASVFCRQVLEGNELERFKSGAKYLVFDAGGGTVDISVHQVIEGGKLREFHKASGGAWGGTQVDKAFTQLLTKLVGEHVLRRFRKMHTEDEIDIMRAFEIKKRCIEPTKDGITRMPLPATLKDLFKEERSEYLKDAIGKTMFPDQITVSGDKMKIGGSLMKKLFTETIDKMVSHLKTIMSDPNVSGTEFIVMVGGFSESRMVQEAIRANFPQIRLVIPREAGLVVLKGAVTFGHCPSSVVERVCRYTYGTDIAKPFVEGEHDEEKKYTYSAGTIWCGDIFDKYVEIGEIVQYGVPQTRQMYSPSSEEQTEICFPLYASTDRNPKYLTDVGVRKVSDMTIQITEMSVPMDEREFEAHITFSGTEIEVKAKEVRTGKVHSVLADFLNV